MAVEDYKILVDLPSDQPALEFDAYAEALRDVIEKSDPRFVVGIFGGWGAGKTTLMQAIERKLDAEKCIPVRFSAWRYEKEEHLIVPLLDTVRAALVSWGEQRRTAAGKSADLAFKTASTIGKVIRSLLAGMSLKAGLPGAVEASFDATKALAQAADIAREDRDAEVPRSFYHASFLALQEAFGKFGADDPARRIVVFVDDLDRCLPQGAPAVMESMKLFFDLQGFVFAVGLDRQVVTAAIDAKYAQAGADGASTTGYRIQGAEYIKKIFHVPFGLFPVAKGRLFDYIDSVCAEARLPGDQESDLRTRVLRHLEYLVGDAGLNPREVKRYINAYTLVLKIMSKRTSADPDAVLCLQTIEFRSDWKLVLESLLGYREAFRRALLQNAGGEYKALENLNPKLRGIPSDFLDYVAANGPGHALLTVPSLDEYIYACESTRSSHGPGLSDLIRDATELRPALEELAAEVLAGSTLPPDHEGLERALSKVGNARSRVLTLSTERHLKHVLLRQFEELEPAIKRLAG